MSVLFRFFFVLFLFRLLLFNNYLLINYIFFQSLFYVSYCLVAIMCCDLSLGYNEFRSAFFFCVFFLFVFVFVFGVCLISLFLYHLLRLCIVLLRIICCFNQPVCLSISLSDELPLFLFTSYLISFLCV